MKWQVFYRDGEAMGYLAMVYLTHFSIIEKNTGDILDQRLLGQETFYILFANGRRSGFQPKQINRKSMINIVQVTWLQQA